MNWIQRYRWLGLLVLNEASCFNAGVVITGRSIKPPPVCVAKRSPALDPFLHRLSGSLIRFPLQSFVIKSQESHYV